MALRIIGGKLRGRTITSPSVEIVRPTPQRVREAIIDMVMARRELTDATVLDVFAGSGAMGIEALSRGAEHCTFVESNIKAATQLTDNVRSLGLTEKATILTIDALKFLSQTQQRFDVIFADPPYAATTYQSMVRAVFDKGLLKMDGLFVVEHSVMMVLPVAAKEYELIGAREFGQTAIGMYHRRIGKSVDA